MRQSLRDHHWVADWTLLSLGLAGFRIGLDPANGWLSNLGEDQSTSAIATNAALATCAFCQ